MSTDFPKDLKYTKEHEWLRVEGNKGLVGITGFAAEQLGDVVAVELPDEGDTIDKGDIFGSVESHKSVSDLYAPISGKVLRVNSPLNDSPEAVNEDPYDEGWMIEIELSKPDELDGLMSVEQYRAFVTEQED